MNGLARLIRMMYKTNTISIWPVKIMLNNQVERQVNKKKDNL
jgi:hypothetical protein